MNNSTKIQHNSLSNSVLDSGLRSSLESDLKSDLESNQRSELEFDTKISFFEKIIKPILFLAATFSIVIVLLQLFFLFQQATGAFEYVSIKEFLIGTSWNPTEGPSFGALPLIVGTFLTTLGAMIIAVPIGILTAIFISEIAPIKLKKLLKFIVELLSGIPSVVYGFFGLIILTDWIRIILNRPTGQSWLAGSIILAIMALPTIISVSVNSLNAVPNEYREAALGLGANKWQTISKIILPAASSGILTAIILGIGRAIGETMAIMMVTGNTAIIPTPITNIFSPVRTVTATIGIEIPETAIGGAHYHILFALVVVLYVIIIVINSIAELLLEKFNKKCNNGKIKKESNKKINKKTNKKTKIISKKFNFWLKSNKKRMSKFLQYLFGLWLFSIWAGIWIGIIFIGIIFLNIRFYNFISSENQQKIAIAIIIGATLLVFAVLTIIIGFLIVNGISVISWDFLTRYPRDLGREGGIFPAIIGTLYLVAGAIVFAVPLGIASGLYLAEYTKPNRFTRLIHMSIDTLNGTPSIVFGLFGFVVFCIFTGWGKTLLAGQLTLGLMILPTIIRTTEQSILSVPQEICEGSYALGANKWYTEKKILIPSAAPGIITGIILGMGRAIGETAPIMFTAAVFNLRRLPKSLFSPVMALPYHLFLLTTTVPGGQDNAYGTALVLLVLVFILYGIATILQSKIDRNKKSFILR